MFNKSLRKKGKVFIIGFHVTPLENTIMPPNLAGAYVDCFSKGETYVEATKNSLNKLAEDGLYPKEILGPILELEVTEWSTYVKERWPNYIDSISNQTEFEDTVLSGGVVYGPFGSYDPQ